MAKIHINYNQYCNEQDELINQMVSKFREIADRNLKEVDGNFLFEYINQHNQFDILEFPETDDKIFPKLVEIDNEFRNCFIAGIKYYKNI